MAIITVEVLGIVERGIIFLRYIPNPPCRFGFIPRLNRALRFADFLPVLVEVAADCSGRGASEIVAGDAEMKMKSFSAPPAFLIQKPSDSVEVSFPCVSPCEVSHQKMEPFHPLSFIPLAVILETQIAFHHPVGDAVKRFVNLVVLVLVTKISFFNGIFIHIAAFKGTLPLLVEPAAALLSSEPIPQRVFVCFGHTYFPTDAGMR